MYVKLKSKKESKVWHDFAASEVAYSNVSYTEDN